MSHTFLRTTLATDFEAPQGRFGDWLTSIDSNPGYRGKYHLVRAWLIEFDEHGVPFREIGLDAEDRVLFAGPGDKDYGFWLDTNMTLADFPGDPVSEGLFDSLWQSSGATRP